MRLSETAMNTRHMSQKHFYQYLYNNTVGCFSSDGHNVSATENLPS